MTTIDRDLRRVVLEVNFDCMTLEKARDIADILLTVNPGAPPLQIKLGKSPETFPKRPGHVATVFPVKRTTAGYGMPATEMFDAAHGLYNKGVCETFDLTNDQIANWMWPTLLEPRDQEIDLSQRSVHPVAILYKKHALIVRPCAVYRPMNDKDANLYVIASSLTFNNVK